MSESKENICVSIKVHTSLYKLIINEKIKQVATVSANNDEEIGGLIADAMRQINPECSVILE